jgi:hypothetical protein
VQDLESSPSDSCDGFPQFDETPSNPPRAQVAQQSAKLHGKLKPNRPQLDADSVATVEADDIVPFPAFADVVPVESLSSLKPSEDESQPPTTPTACIIIQNELVDTAAILREANCTNEQPTMAEGTSILTENLATPSTQTQSPTIVVTASTETDESTKNDSNDAGEDVEDDEGNCENMTRFKTWGAPFARNKPRMIFPNLVSWTLVE